MLEHLLESLGRALIHQRAGMEGVVYNHLHAQRATARIEVSSRAFVFNGALPPQYTADGVGISPPISWNHVPADAMSLALLVEDADSPTPHPLVHAIIVNLPPGRESIEEGALSSPHHAGAGLDTGRNSYLQQAWLPRILRRGRELIAMCSRSSRCRQDRHSHRHQGAVSSWQRFSTGPLPPDASSEHTRD